MGKTTKQKHKTCLCLFSSQKAPIKIFSNGGDDKLVFSNFQKTGRYRLSAGTK